MVVDILIATYNGEKYIAPQLLSLLFQSHREIRILVHDDGSTDATRDIVRSIATKDNRVHLIEDGITLGSAGRNFMHLLKYSEAEVTMFCDQDDIWFDNKVAKMLDVFRNKDQSIAEVLFSDLYLWHPETGIEGTVMLDKPRTLENWLFKNGGAHGCASMFNGAMRNLLLRWQGDVSMHDHVLCLLGVTLGKLSYMQEPLMLYRRHPESVTSCFAVKASFWEYLYSHRNVPVLEARHYDTIAHFLVIYGKDLKESDKNLIKSFLKMKSETLFARLASVVRNRFQIRNSVFLLLVKILLRPFIGVVMPRGRSD